MIGAVARGIGGAIVGEVAVALALNTGSFDKGVGDSVKFAEKQYNSAFSGIGSSGASMFGKLAKLAVASGLVAGAISFSKSAIKLGSDLQEVQNVVDVTYGSMSSKVNEFSQNAIETAGLSETVAKQYMGTFGAMNKAFGFTTEQSYEMSKSITQLTGDVASFYNLSSDEAATKLKSIWTGETETLKDLGVVMTQNALDQYALANGYGKTTAKMSEQEKVALRYAFVQQKLSLASGDFVRTQDGWANQTRVLTLRWQQFMATIGQGLINVLTPLVKMLNLLIGKLQVFANAFKKFTASLFGDASGGSSTSSSIANVTDGLSGIGTSATDSADAVSSASKEIKRSLGKMDEINQLGSNNNSDSSSGLGSATSGISGIGDMDVTDDINSSSSAIDKLTDKIKKLIKPLQDIDFTNLKNGLDKVKEALKPITKKLGEGLEWLWTNILVPVAKWTIEDAVPSFLYAVAGALDFLNGVIDYAKPYLQFLWEEFLEPIAKWTGGIIVDVLKKIGDRLSIIGDWLSENAPAIEDVREDLGPFAGMFKEIAKFLGNIISLAWDNFKKKMSDLYTYVLKPIWDYFLEPLWTKHWSKFRAMASLLEGIFGAMNKLMEGDWKGAGESILGGLTDGLKELWEGSFVKRYLVDPLVDGFKKLLGIHSPSTVFFDFGTNIIEGLGNGIISMKDWFVGKWNMVKSWFTDIIPKVKTKFEDTKESIKTKWSSVTSGIADKYGNIKTKFEETKTSLQNKWNTLLSGLKSATLEIQPKIANVTGSVKGFTNDIIGKLNSKLPSWLPKIPMLATGGYFTANNPQLAIVGDNKREPEIVTPESKIYDQTLKAIKDSGGASGKQELEITIYHKYEDGKTIIQKINQAEIDEGKVLLLT